MNNAGIDPSAIAAQRRGRIHALRMRVAVGAVSAFVAIWCVLFVQLATGHDPGLNDASTVAVVQSADPDAETSSDTSDSSPVTDTGTDASADLGSATPSSAGSGAVTTSQS